MSFKDTRNAAELALAPARPGERKLARFGSLKLDIGAKVVTPGIISKASDITGATRSQFGDIVKLKLETEELSRTISSTLSQFDANRSAVEAGTYTSPISTFDPTVGGIPPADQFLQFSSLKPGQPIPANFASKITERKTQLTALSGRISSAFTGTAFSGVSIRENFKRMPFPLDDDLDLPSTPRLAMGGTYAQADDVLKDKRRFAIKGVHVASGKPSFWSRLLSLTQIKAVPLMNPVVNQIFKDRKNAGSWSEPVSPFAAQYPYNRVQQTEAGHIFEFDDTPGAERIHLFHRSGSFIEMHPDGTVVYKSLKDGYDLTIGDKHVKVCGSCHVSVDGNATIFTKGNVEVQSDGEINLTAKKDFNVFADNINLNAKKTFKGDGTKIDLRYISLPTSLMPVAMAGGFAPRINIAAIIADFPKSNIKDVLAKMAKNPMDPKTANLEIKLNATAVPVPPENPLSNPGLYTKKGAAAAAYRAHLFDTQEETDDTEMYVAHIGLQQALGDYTGDPRTLGGKFSTLEGPSLSTERNTPSVDYLNYDDFKGKFNYANNFVLGGTSFTLQDLVDIAIYPGIIIPLKPTTSI